MRNISKTMLYGAFLPQIVAFTFLLLAGAISYAPPAHALCAASEITGSWRNVDPAARGMTRLNVIFFCNDVIARGVGGPPPPPPPPPWQVEMWGSCHPTDCPWGATTASPVPAAAFPVTRLSAFYDQGFARRTVTIRLVGGFLIVDIWTDFRDPARRDYRLHERFRRA